jgi:uncharacterized protein (UPF0332 family)
MTGFSKLIQSGRIEPGKFARSQVMNCIEVSRRDLQAAASIIHSSPEWAFNIAYNAMHQAGRAFMFHAGYRAKGVGHHATVIFFLRIGLPARFQELVMIQDSMRRKRNRAIYDHVGLISGNEAAEALTVAEEFVEQITKLIGNQE